MMVGGVFGAGIQARLSLASKTAEMTGRTLSI